MPPSSAARKTKETVDPASARPALLLDWYDRHRRKLPWRPHAGERADPYRVWDSSVARAVGRIRPYLQMTNLSNTGYEEIVNVRMPPRGFVGGFEIVLPMARSGS